MNHILITYKRVVNHMVKSKNYVNVGVKPNTKRLLQVSKKLFLDEHTPMREMHISDNKIIYEAIVYYLKGTEYEKEINNECLLNLGV